MERLSSGLRINRAADDAAGLAIAEGMRAQVNGMNQASRNSLDGVSLLQTAEGGLNETHAILLRMRVLAVQAANSGVMSKESLGAIQAEMTQLTADIDRIATSIEFNGHTLLDGSFHKKSLQVGANAGDVKIVSINSGITEAVPGSPAGTALWGVDKVSGTPGDPAAITYPITVEEEVAGQLKTAEVPTPTPIPRTVDELVAALNADPSFGPLFTVEAGAHRRSPTEFVSSTNVIITAKEPGRGEITITGIPTSPTAPAPSKSRLSSGATRCPSASAGSVRRTFSGPSST